MCHHVTFSVPPEPTSVPAARKFCRDTLDAWGLQDLVDDAQLIVSELVTNGLLYAGTPIGLTVSAETENLELAVSDGSRTMPLVRPHREDLSRDVDAVNSAGTPQESSGDQDRRWQVGAAGSVVGGRGLQLVMSLAEEWGVDLSGTGKSVWARLPIAQPWAPAADCTCLAGTTRLSSGHTVAAG